MITKKDIQYSDKNREYFASSRQDVASFIPLKTKTILDVGMGEGNFLYALKKDRSDIETWGVELENKSFNKAKDKVDKAFEGTVEENLKNLPDNYFDCITFNDVLEHLVDPWFVLEKIKTKLKNNGVVVASIPNVRFIDNLKNLIFYKQWRYTKSGILDKTHLRFFTEKSIPALFEESGLKLQLLKGINPKNGWKFRIINSILFGAIDDTNYMQFIAIAKKSYEK